MFKALIYCRVSTEEQAKDGRHSLKTQEALNTKAVLDSGKYELAKNGVYVDAGKTATNMNRAGLQDLLIRVQEDKYIKAVYVLDTDRLSRNINDHTTIRAILQKHGVTLISTSQPGIEDTPEGNFMDTIIAGVNQLQSQITSRKTLKSMEQRFNEGWWVTRATVGYLNAGEKENSDKRIIITDPIKGPHIKELFYSYASGNYSMMELRDILFKKGLTSHTGGKLGVSNMFLIIKNPFYYGEMRWRGLIKIGKHTPLITKDTYDRCQHVRETNNHFACRRRKHSFLLNGYIVSATSGLRFIGEHHVKKDKNYYRAYISSKNKPAKIPESDKGINAERLEHQIAELFKGIQFSEKFVDKLQERVKFIYTVKKLDVERNKRKLFAMRANAENKLTVAEEKLLSGTLDDSDFTRIKIKQREIIAGLDEEMAKLERSKNIKVDIIQKVILLARNIGEAYEKAPPELKKVYLSLFWEKFEVADKKLVNSTPSSIIRALLDSGTVCFSKKQKPFPMEKAFAEKNPLLRESIRIRTERGAYWDLNPD